MSELTNIKRRLYFVAVIDFTFTVALFAISLLLLRGFRINTLDDPISTIVWMSIFPCYAIQLILVSTLLAEYKDDNVTRLLNLRMNSNSIRNVNLCLLFSLPEIFFFTYFYIPWSLLSLIGTISVVAKVILYYYTLGILSNSNRVYYLFQPTYSNLSSRAPSYGTLAPPTYEDAVKENPEISSTTSTTENTPI